MKDKRDKGLRGPSKPLLLWRVLGFQVFLALASAPVCSQSLVQEVVPDDVADFIRFGSNVHVLGDTAVVLAPGQIGTPPVPGRVYVYVRAEARWQLAAEFTTPSFSGLGATASLSHRRLVIGDAFANGGLGVAYVYKRVSGGASGPSSDTWVKEADLVSGEAMTQFGASVAIDKSTEQTIVVGAPAASVGGLDIGAMFVFTLDNAGTPDDDSDDSWVGIARIQPKRRDAELLGGHVAIDSGTIMSSLFLATSVPVYRVSDGGTPGLAADDAVTFESFLEPGLLPVVPLDRFGFHISISGDVAVVGAYGWTGNSGATFVFERTLEGWREQAALVPTDTAPLQLFGYSTAIEGGRIVVGAPGDAASIGAAYVFVRAGDGWIEESKFAHPGGLPKDSFGSGVAVSNRSILVGAGTESEHGLFAGAAYAFSIE